MPSREFSPGAGLQVPLECRGGLFLVELDHDERAPRSVFARVMGKPRIVRVETIHHVGRQSDVIGMRFREALENVDEALRLTHALRLRNDQTVRKVGLCCDVPEFPL